MKNKILLINTIPSSWKDKKLEVNMPPGILAMGTWIKKNSNFNVKIIDCLIEEEYLDIIKKEVNEGNVLYAGISVMSSCIPNAMEVTRLIKKLDPKVSIVWGGVHCKLYPEQTIAHPLIDYVVYAEGEIPALNLAINLSKGKSMEHVNGILYKKKNKVIRNPPEKVVDLNDLGILSYELLNQKVFKKEMATMSTSRGCPHRCTFCINVVTKDTKWRAMSAQNVVQEIEFLIKKYNIKVLGFSDDCFFVDKQRAEKIADLLIKKNISLQILAAARADYFTHNIMTEELLTKWKKCGLYCISMGIEFGSQKMRDYIKKEITEKDVITSVKMLKKVGIGGTFAFMTGFPNETKEDTYATINLIKKITNMNQGILVQKDGNKIYSWFDKIRIAGPQVYRPYPGGELYNQVVKDYKLYIPNSLDNWEKYFKENTRYKIEEYPWIKNPDFYAGLQFYIKSGKANLSTFLQRIAMPYPLKFKIIYSLFWPFSRIRTLFNIFSFPIEYHLGKKLGLIDEYET